MSEKKYFIQTYGCQANIKDSQVMAGTLDALGLVNTGNYKKADIIIVNSCSVRQKSEDKVYGWGIRLGTRDEYIEKKGKQVVFVTGCMVGSAKGKRTRVAFEELKERLYWADYLLSPEEEHTLPSILVKHGLVDDWALKAFNIKNTEKIQDISQKTNPKFHNDTDWAYVNISTGCDNFCTFCVVPFARGEEKSRSEDDILHEINHLIKRGYGNIMLVGQNVNSWGLDKKTKFQLRAGSKHEIPFAKLLRDIHLLSGVNKINFISSNPFDFTQDLIDTLELPKITRYLHFAVQSGNNDILKKMNRRHTIEEFKTIMDKIKSKIPEMKFGTDVIVGFPGETEEQFMDTVALFEQYPFETAFISIYSPREGTFAQKNFSDNVPLKEKKRRHALLTKVWKQTRKKDLLR